MAEIQSPCILLCAIDMTSGYCYGCGRTRDEIAEWMNYTNNERRQIIAGLDQRLETIERKPRRQTRRTRMARQRGITADRRTRFEPENPS